MNPRMTLRCLVALTLSMFGVCFSALAEQTDAPAEHIIVMYDGSKSMESLPEPDTAQAFIAELIHVASISGKPVKIAVIFYNGNGVKVLGDDKKMPTAALASLHKKVLQEWERPFGATPADESFQECVRIVKELPGNARIIVVNFGDGQPESGRLRPGEFAEVQQAMDQKIDSIRKLGYPPKTTQQVVERFLNAANTPGTEEWKQIYERIQLQAEFEFCKRNAAVLKGAKARFISVDFGGGIEQLREIHDAAGGLDSDYLVVQPANTVIERLHNLKVTQLDGILVPRSVQLPADQSSFRMDYEHQLDKVGEAALVTIVFHRPVEDFTDDCQLSIDAAGVTYNLDEKNQDANAFFSFDSSGKVATATLVLQSLPQDGKVVIHFQSPGFSMHPPEMTIFTHLRLSSDLDPVVRPHHLPSDALPPYSIQQNREVGWEAWIGIKDNPKPIPLSGIELIWKNRRDGNSFRLELEADRQRPGVFQSSKKSRMPSGQFDLEVNYLLESGAQFRLRIPTHFQSQRNDEYIALEIDESSRNSDHFAIGPVGDATREAEVKAIVRSMNVDYPITVEVLVIGLADSNGRSPQAAWVAPVQRQITLHPGRPHPLLIKLKLPDVIEDGLEDDLYTARLQCRRLDLATIMDVRPLRQLRSTTGRSIDEVTFTLHRPQLSLSVPRGPKNELSRSSNEGEHITLHVDFGTPFQRSVVVNVTHDSTELREVQLQLAPMQDEEGRDIPIESASLVLATDCDAKQEVKPGQTATFRLLLDVDEPINGQMILRLSGNGLRTVEVPVVVKTRERLLGQLVQVGSYGLGLLLLPLIVLGFIRWRRAAPNGSGNAFVFNSKRPLFDISTESATGGKALLRFGSVWTVLLGGRKKTTSQSIRVAPKDISRTNSAQFFKPDPDGIEARVNEFYIDDDAQPEFHVEIIESKKCDRQMTRYKRAIRRRMLLATALVLIGYFFFAPPVLSAAQWLFDIVRL